MNEQECVRDVVHLDIKQRHSAESFSDTGERKCELSEFRTGNRIGDFEEHKCEFRRVHDEIRHATIKLRVK